VIEAVEADRGQDVLHERGPRRVVAGDGDRRPLRDLRLLRGRLLLATGLNALADERHGHGVRHTTLRAGCAARSAALSSATGDLAAVVTCRGGMDKLVVSSGRHEAAYLDYASPSFGHVFRPAWPEPAQAHGADGR
jgi:predicted phage gp36 major capsid-like protein